MMKAKQKAKRINLPRVELIVIILIAGILVGYGIISGQNSLNAPVLKEGMWWDVNVESTQLMVATMGPPHVIYYRERYVVEKLENKKGIDSWKISPYFYNQNFDEASGKFIESLSETPTRSTWLRKNDLAPVYVTEYSQQAGEPVEYNWYFDSSQPTPFVMHNTVKLPVFPLEVGKKDYNIWYINEKTGEKTLQDMVYQKVTIVSAEKIKDKLQGKAQSLKGTFFEVEFGNSYTGEKETTQIWASGVPWPVYSETGTIYKEWLTDWGN